MKKILMAEDEENISDFVSRGLRNFNYEVTVAADGDEAWRLLEKENNFDLVMLDIRMPGLSGLEVCRRIRDVFGYRTPVLMLTALGTTNDIVDGLHAGADDYIVKPFMFMELMARIEALLRRSGANTERVMTCGDLKLDIASHQALRGDRTIDLSIKELRLLQYMMEHEGEELSRRQLLKDVWDKDFDTNTNVVDVYVRYLRQKIDADFDAKLIHTVVGTGYCFRKNENS
jgi:DNA-binding response OmpR family regulator